jgi:hypothetical protein
MSIKKTLSEKLELLLTKKLQHSSTVDKITELVKRAEEIAQTIELLEKENYSDSVLKDKTRFISLFEERYYLIKLNSDGTINFAEEITLI